MDNDALDSVDQFESAVIAILDWLRRLPSHDPEWRWRRRSVLAVVPWCSA